MPRTANGANTVRRTDSACVDLFAVIGALRANPTAAVRLFERAYQEDPALALRILLWGRDAREGAGERATFKIILHWLEKRHPAVAVALVRSGAIQRLGRWDDMLVLGRPESLSAVAHEVATAIIAGDRLAAKWMPRNGPVAAKLYGALGVTPAQWRKGLAALSDTVEQRLCRKDWAGISYRAVPSVAAARYQSVFLRHDYARYRSYIDAVVAGRETMHASAVFAHDIVKAARMAADGGAAATAQWAQLPKLELAGSALVLCDVSGSMNVELSGRTSALDVCIALGLQLSEAMPAPFTNQVLTFTRTPCWHTITGSTLAERVRSLEAAPWGMNTNIQAAFELLLARRAELGFVMPRSLIVLSDMEFDVADSRNRTNHEAARRKFAAAGVELPTLVYWNLAGRAGNLPAGNVPGVVLVSGFSAQIAQTVLSGDFDALSPRAVMLAAVSGERYAISGLT